MHPEPAPHSRPVDADHLPDGLVVAGADARITLVNAAATRIVGRSAAELLGRDLRQALPLQDTTGRRWWAAVDPWRGLATRTGHRERLLVLPCGTEVLVTARFVRTGRSLPVSEVVVMLRDTESRRRAEADHAGLISTVAHELRSPLTSVKGFTSTLLRRWDRFSDDQKRLMLTTVEADADRVTRLITELLDISRIDAGRLEVRRQPLDLVAAARRHVERMVAAGHDEQRFTVVQGDSLPEVWADPDRVDQVLANLVENAVRHGEGQVTVTVEPSLGPGDGSAVRPLPTADGDAAAGRSVPDGVVVTVDDEGEGIPEAQLGMVFTKFWRGNRRGGTGLGLYLVRGLVEAHDGRVVVGRAPGGGARFRFILPTAVPDSQR